MGVQESTGNDEDVFSWSSEYDGGNTATPISEGSREEDSHNNDEVPHQNQASSRIVWQTAGRWTRRFRSEDQVDETTFFQAYIEDHDLRDIGTAVDTDEGSLMQWLGAEPEEASVSAVASHSMSSEDHPSALASGFNEPQCNTDFDWLTSCKAVRRYICEYYDALTRRQRQILVHVVAQHRGTTTACGTYCPNALLDSQVAMSRFTDWCEEYTFPFDQAYTRAFPVSVELYQNLPAIVVVQHLEDGILPLAVEVITDAHRIHLVMMAQSHEFVSEIMDWTHTQTEVRLPYVLTYQDQRATYWQRLSIVAGAVLRVRCVTDAELDNPVQSTVETGPSLEYYSHATWSSLHTNPEPEHPCEECQETEEHTLLQASVLMQNIVAVILPYNAPPEIGDIHY